MSLENLLKIRQLQRPARAARPWCCPTTFCLKAARARPSDSDNLPPPDVIAQEIVDDLEAALEQFRLIAGRVQVGAAN